MPTPRVAENGVAAPSGGDGDGDGLPYWATALRQDVRTLSRDIRDLGRDLGGRFEAGLRFQTWALMVIAMLALVLNSALILGSLYFRANGNGVTVATQNPPVVAAPVAP